MNQVNQSLPLGSPHYGLGTELIYSKICPPSTSCCLVPSNDVKEADSRGSVVESILQESCSSHLSIFKGLGQFCPFRASNMATRDFDASPCRKEKKGQKCFRDGSQKTFESMPSPSCVVWSFPYVPWNEK